MNNSCLVTRCFNFCLFRRCWVMTTVWQPCWSTKLLHCVGMPRVAHRCTMLHPEATQRSWPVWCRLPLQQTHKINCWTTNNTPHYTGLLTKVRSAQTHPRNLQLITETSMTNDLEFFLFVFRAWRLFGGFTWIQNIYPWRGKPFHPPALCSVSITFALFLLFTFKLITSFRRNNNSLLV